MKKLTITFIILDILVAICFFVVYGPFESFRNLIITTSIRTKTHDYIAYTFWSDETINEVQNLNSVIPFKENVDLGEIVIDSSPRDSYDNEYDEQVLTRDEGNDLYKYIKVKIADKYDAHLVAIYDPSTVKLMASVKFNSGGNSGLERVSSMLKRYNGVVGINAGGFLDLGDTVYDKPLGYVIKDSKAIWSPNNKKAQLIGFTNENKLLLTEATADEAIEMGMRDAIQFGPFLIVNGERIRFNNGAGGFDRAARVAIAQRKDGIVFFLVSEGTHAKGPNMGEMADLLLKYGAYNAANLDGGTSTQLVIDGKLINTPKNIYGNIVNGGRRVVTAWGVIPNKDA